MTLIFKNVKEEFLPLFKELSKAINAKYELKEDKSIQSPMQKALDELNRGEVTKWESLEAFKRAMEK